MSRRGKVRAGVAAAVTGLLAAAAAMLALDTAHAASTGPGGRRGVPQSLPSIVPAGAGAGKL